MSRHPTSATAPFAQRLTKRVLGTVERFLHVEAISGIVLLLAAGAALAWANSPFAESYRHLWEMPLTLGIGSHSVVRSLHFVINDGLMTLFFLVVGMEIRREVHDGALANPRAAALPLAAALGGVAVPALIYIAFNTAPLVRDGWAVPTATDIAFAVGVLALLGKGIPHSIRIFLLMLAVIDDIAAVVIIAIFYSQGLDHAGIAVAITGIAFVLGLRAIRIEHALAYLLPGAILWLGLLQTGAHPTLAGVILGLMTPVESTRNGAAPVVRLQRTLHPWIAYGVMPVFALANAGVSIEASTLADGSARTVMIGVVAALALGKPVGICGASWLAVRLGWCRLPPGVTWGGVWLVGALGGIGFTMSIFIATLAFENGQLLAAAKLGVLLASAIAGSLGLAAGFTLRAAQRARHLQ